MQRHCSSLHSLSNTNALYCRAVRGNNFNSLDLVDNWFLAIWLVKNPKSLRSSGTNIPLPLFRFAPSRACIWHFSGFAFSKFAKPAHEHHLASLARASQTCLCIPWQFSAIYKLLTPNTDNKVKKLVMFFALPQFTYNGTLHLDKPTRSDLRCAATQSALSPVLFIN